MDQGELSVAKRYFALAETYANRPVLARRGTLPSLVKFMAPQHNREVQLVAAKTICLLAEHPENLEVVVKHPNLIQTLFDAYKQCSGTDPELHDTIARIFAHLKPALGEGTEEEAAADNKENFIAGGKTAEANASPSFHDPGQSIRTVKNRTTRISKGASQATKYRTVVIEVHNLAEEEDYTELEELLLTTRGVVSYTTERQLPSSYVKTSTADVDGVARITLYLTTPTLALRKLLLDQGFDHEVISEKEVAGMSGIGGDSSGAYPASGPASAAAMDFRESLVLHGAESNSLSERLRKQKEDRDRKTVKERSVLTNFLGKLTSSFW